MLRQFLEVLADHKIQIFIGAALIFTIGLIAVHAVGKASEHGIRSDEEERFR